MTRVPLVAALVFLVLISRTTAQEAKVTPATKIPAKQSAAADKPAADKPASQPIPEKVNAKPATKPEEKKAAGAPTASAPTASAPTASTPTAKPEEKPKSAAATDPMKKGEEELLAGHSSHGEAFNEGARQQAYLMNSTGKIDFPVTTKKPLARKFIEQGVGQIFGFWYFEAERSFRQAAAIDPDCAMAYWGMAMVNKSNSKRGPAFMAEAVKRKTGLTDREIMYIDGLDAYIKDTKDKKRGAKFAQSFEQIVMKYPDDIEAKAFLGLQLWLDRSSTPLNSYLAMDALFNEILAVNPLHPCHHFRIHMWDLDTTKSKKALNSAARCGQSAPGIAHMWHMPGHTYSKLKRYEDAAWQQEASARVDHAHMIRDGVLPDRIHNFAHNNEWLIRNLNYLGRMHDAVELAKNMIELPRHPKYNMSSRRGSSTYYGRLRLFQTLTDFELWDELIRLTDTMYLEPTDDFDEQVKRLRYLGRAQFRIGKADEGSKQLAALEALLKSETEKRDKAADTATEKAKKEKKNDKQIKQAVDAAKRPFAAKVSNLERSVHELNGYVAANDKKYKEALDLFKKAGGISKSYLADLQRLNGDAAGAEKALRDELPRSTHQVLPIAELVELLWKLDKKDEAKKSFAELRKVAATADLNAPQLARLAPIAKAFGYPADWRIAREIPKDIGDRPKHDDLGPFRWHPTAAESWTLKDVNQKSVSLADYRGKPLVVIFYLGYGCLHCAEQLQAFAPKASEFKAVGISIVAISTDNEEDLKISHENYKKGTFPFPLLSDSDLNVFKKYRAHDDFEKKPLHGTFLIDGNGLVRWHDVSYEPFNNPDFVIKEATRLLSRDEVKVTSR
ncbi:MAG: redoxin domain-containing protein [Planctomycetota bacterium]|nr:redoxin domain-containing protein [Planctomycetota bacterium]